MQAQTLQGKLALRDISSVYVENVGAYEGRVKSEALNYALLHSPLSTLHSLNFGLTYKNHWLKFSFQNTTQEKEKYYLVFNSVMDDTMVFYKFVNNELIEKQTLGEVIPFNQRKNAARNPVIPITFQAGEKADFLIKVSGVGDPMNLNGFLMNEDTYRHWIEDKTTISALTFGIMFVILLLNISFYIITREHLYFIFALQVLVSTLALMYFEGYSHQYLFPNSSYWSREIIAIAFCLTFIFNNLFTDNIFNFKEISRKAHLISISLTYVSLIVLFLSFFHPYGFQFFIRFGVILPSLIAMLLMFGIYSIRKNKNLFYFFVSLATASLIIFGTTFQVYLAGLLPNNMFTQYSMHLAVVFQSIFLVLAVNDRFRQIREDNDRYRVQLVEAMEHYSQNLITNIETERQRLAVDIHDGLGQNLLVIRNKILLTLKKKPSLANFKNTLESLMEVTTDALEDARNMSHNLRPPILNTFGLSVAIQSLVEKMRQSSTLNLHLDMPQPIDGLVDKNLEINVYRILQEGFNNVIKHSKASTVTIKIETIENFLQIIFQDNGTGFETKTAKSGQGLLGIKERVSLLKGTLIIESEIQKGTKILIKIPVYTGNSF